jgi:hypothetical protein
LLHARTSSPPKLAVTPQDSKHINAHLWNTDVHLARRERDSREVMSGVSDPPLCTHVRSGLEPLFLLHVVHLWCWSVLRLAKLLLSCWAVIVLSYNVDGLLESVHSRHVRVVRCPR